MSEMVERVAVAMAESEGDSVMDHWRRRARAAIEAMREPTNAMIAKAVRDEGADEAWVKIHWRAMIDAALEEK